MNLQAILDDLNIHYRVLRHDSRYTAQGLAAAEHVSGRKVIKPVIVRADGQFVMCVLPASYKVDLEELKAQIEASEVRLADEGDMRQIFQDCELGAQPPVGRFWGMTTLMDESLCAHNHVTFQTGSHNEAVTMSLAEYRRLAMPEMAHFGRCGD